MGVTQKACISAEGREGQGMLYGSGCLQDVPQGGHAKCRHWSRAACLQRGLLRFARQRSGGHCCVQAAAGHCRFTSCCYQLCFLLLSPGHSQALGDRLPFFQERCSPDPSTAHPPPLRSPLPPCSHTQLCKQFTTQSCMRYVRQRHGSKPPYRRCAC